MTGRAFVIFCATSAMFLLSATAVGQFIHTNDAPQIPHLSSIPEKIGVPLHSSKENAGLMDGDHDAWLDSEVAPTLNSQSGIPSEPLLRPR